MLFSMWGKKTGVSWRKWGCHTAEQEGKDDSSEAKKSNNYILYIFCSTLLDCFFKQNTFEKRKNKGNKENLIKRHKESRRPAVCDLRLMHQQAWMFLRSWTTWNADSVQTYATLHTAAMLRISGQSDADLQRYLRRTHTHTHRFIAFIERHI